MRIIEPFRISLFHSQVKTNLPSYSSKRFSVFAEVPIRSSNSKRRKNRQPFQLSFWLWFYIINFLVRGSALSAMLPDAEQSASTGFDRWLFGVEFALHWTFAQHALEWPNAGSVLTIGKTNLVANCNRDQTGQSSVSFWKLLVCERLPLKEAIRGSRFAKRARYQSEKKNSWKRAFSRKNSSLITWEFIKFAIPQIKDARWVLLWLSKPQSVGGRPESTNF